MAGFGNDVAQNGLFICFFIIISEFINLKERKPSFI